MAKVEFECLKIWWDCSFSAIKSLQSSSECNKRHKKANVFCGREKTVTLNFRSVINWMFVSFHPIYVYALLKSVIAFGDGDFGRNLG